MEGLYFFIGGFILIFIFGNLISHLYYKRKQRFFLSSLKGKDFTIIRNARVNIESSGKNPYNHQVHKADIIFFGEHLFLLITSKIFRQAKPIIQISRIGNSEKFSDVLEEVQYISKMKIDDQLRITGFSMRGTFRVNYKLFMHFKNTGFKLEDYLEIDI